MRKTALESEGEYIESNHKGEDRRVPDQPIFAKAKHRLGAQFGNIYFFLLLYMGSVILAALFISFVTSLSLVCFFLGAWLFNDISPIFGINGTAPDVRVYCEAILNIIGPCYHVVLVHPLVIYLPMQAYFYYKKNASYGMRKMDLKIVRSDGRECSLIRSFLIRYLLCMVLPFYLPFYAVALLADPPVISHLSFGNFALASMLLVMVDYLTIFTKRHRCLHDYIADTIVVEVADSVSKKTNPDIVTQAARQPSPVST